MKPNKSPILVTGASTGIGRAVVEALSQKQRLVYAGARKQSDLEELATLPHVSALRLDVTEQGDINDLVERLQQGDSGLGGIVNNAGVCDLWPLMETEEEDITRIFRVNLYGLHNLTRAMFPFLRQGHGRIVNISSVGGIATPKDCGVYDMSKHALEAYFDVLRAELQETSIRVSLIEPGSFNTDVWKSIRPVYEERLARNPDMVTASFFTAIQDKLTRVIQASQKNDTAEKVADTVVEAILADEPKPRYLVTPSDGQFYWVVNALLSKVAQLNDGSEYGVSREELHRLLDSALDSTQVAVRSG